MDDDEVGGVLRVSSLVGGVVVGVVRWPKHRVLDDGFRANVQIGSRRLGGGVLLLFTGLCCSVVIA